MPFGVAPAAQAAGMTITGTVYNDQDHDGTKDAASGSGATAVLGDPGVAGAKVRAYDSTGASVATVATTDNAGAYTLTVAGTATTAVRLEFEAPAGYESSRAPAASMLTTNASSVRFVLTTDGPLVANYAVQRPGDYCQSNPGLCSSIFPWDTTSGLGQALTDLSDTGIIGFPYPETANDTTPAPTVEAVGTVTGPVYGLAYDVVSKATFSSSFLHRKSPFLSSLSTNQTGLIFRTTDAGVTTIWANLNTLFPAQNPGGANPHPIATTDWLNDNASAPLIGKRGLGDLDISTDGRYLYSVGLNDKAVYRLSSITAPAAAADVSRFPVPTPASCTNAADVQPFGLGIKGDGTVFVGAVCSGQVGGASALRYYVWTLSSAGVYTLVLDTPVPNSTISMNKVGGVTPIAPTMPTAPRWNAWGFSDTWTNADRVFTSNAAYAAGGQEVHPQPMLSDIEFDGDNLILGVRDRYGDQGLGDEKRFDQEPYAHGQGDVVRVCNVSGTLVIEGGASCTTTDGEWFGNDIPSDGWHESGLGAVVALSSKPGVVTTAYDPRAYNAGRVNTVFNEMGVTNLQKTDTAVATASLGGYSASVLGGDISKAWGKTNGMGDLEALCDSAPLEIGNRVWNDTDRDGIQDAGEAGIAGVTVTLYNAAGTAAIVGGTAVTNAAGEYYFTTDATRSGSSTTDDIGGGLAVRTGYTLRIGTAANYLAAGPLNGLVATPANQTVTDAYTGQSDAIDSDTALVDTNGATGSGVLGVDVFPVITVAEATMNPGENNHTYDSGFNVPITYTAVDLALQKVVTARSGNLAAGSGSVTFTMTVTNQGAVSVNPVVITDYINTAHFSALAATQTVTTSGGVLTADWSTGATPSITLPYALASGASVTVPITLTVANPLTGNPTALTNRAEISAFDTDNNAANGNSADGRVYDVDSVADATNSNDGTEKDDVVNEARYANTAGVTGSPSATLDEDDADIASVPLTGIDLALQKTVTSRTGSLFGGGTVTFQLTVVNQGAVAVNPVVITDYINTSHFQALGVAQTVTTSGGATTAAWSTGANPSITLPYGLAAGASVTVPITLTVANPIVGTPTALTNRAEISAFDTDNNAANGNSADGAVFDVDSVADTTPGNEGTEKDDVVAEARYTNTAGTTGTPSATLDEDDADIASVPLIAADLALQKGATSRAGSLFGGGTVTFTMTVTNQGSQSIFPVVVTDYINTNHFQGLAVAQTVTTSGGATTAAWSTGATPSITLPYALAAGASVTVPITLTVVTPLVGAPTALTNRAEITAFDTDNNAANGNSSTGWVYDVDSVADSTSSNDGTEKDDVVNEARYTNTAGITGTPSGTLDEDDADIASVPLIAVDLALRKAYTSTGGLLVNGNGTVTFTMTVTNQGSQSVSPIVVTDYINTSHFQALAVAQTVTTSGGATTASWSIGATPSITLPYPLAAGASVTVPITLSVNPSALVNPLANIALTNRAEISAFDTDSNAANGNSSTGWVYDVDSVADATNSNDGTEKDDVVTEARYTNTAGITGTPSGTLDEDDADVASVPLYDLALIKDLAPTENGYVVGPLPDSVGFDITVTNQGLNPNYHVRVQDRPEADMTLVPAANASQTPTSSLGNARAVVYGGTDYFTIDQLLPGESVTFRVYVNAVIDGSSPYVNVAEIIAFDNDVNPLNAVPSYVQDVDSTPANNIASEDDQDNAQVITRQLAIGSTLFFDTDKDGDADNRAGSGILVQLLNGAGTVVDTAVTDAGGNYFFDGVAEGNYRVGVPTAQAGAGVNPAALTGYVSIPGFSATPSSANTMIGGTNDDGDVATGWLARSAQFAMTYEGHGGNDTEDLTNAVTYLGTAVPDATANLNIDFIFQPVPTYRVGNLVWRDTNNNGLVDGAETGVDGVTVQLYTSANALVATTTTAGGGHYLFDNRAAGDYYVQIPASEFTIGGALAGWRASSNGVEADPDTNVDNNSNATQAGPTTLAKTGVFTLGSPSDPYDANEPTTETDSDAWTDGNNRSNLTVDLGFYELLRIGSTLFLDTDKNGTADVRAGSGILVQLLDGSDAVMASAITDGGGNYFFAGVTPGDYRVGVPTDQTGAGVNPAALAGYVSIPGFSATPSAVNTLEGGIDDDGDVATDWLARSATFTMSFGGHGSNDAIDLANAETYLGTVVPDATANLNIDFIFQPAPTYRVGNLVWRDINNNGVVDVLESGVDGVTVNLYTSANVPVATTTTAGGGHYEFDTLPAGDYYVQIPAAEFASGAPLFGWRASSGTGIEADPNTDIDNDSNAIQAGPTTLATTGVFTLGATADPFDHSEPTDETDTDAWGDGDDRSNLTVDLGFYELLRIGSTLFLDTDKNGTADVRAVAGIHVQLLNGMGVVVDEVDTDVNGNYFFAGVVPGAYRVGIPADQTAAGSPTALVGYVSVPGTSTSPSALNTLIGGSNDDGDVATGWLARSDTFLMNFGAVGPNDLIDLGYAATYLGSLVADATSNLNIDFIFQPVPTYRVGDLVWRDTNNDGLVNGGESGIDGVTVDLYTSAGVFVATTTTASGGHYLFETLPAGDYYVQIPAAEFTTGGDLIGLRASSNGVEADPDTNVNNNSNAIQVNPTALAATGVFTLGSPTDPFDHTEPINDSDFGPWVDGDDRSNLSVDLGFYELLRIGSTLFLDTDKNGTADVRAQDGILVQLVNGSGVVIDAAVTDAAGNYFFDEVVPGNYQVGIPVSQAGVDVIPAALTGYISVPGSTITPSAENTLESGTDDDGAIDLGNGWLAISSQFAMTYGGVGSNHPTDLAYAELYLGTPVPDYTANLNIDFIFQPLPTYRVGNLVWRDTNNDGLVNGSEAGVAGVTVDLYTSTDVFVATTTTDLDGHYLFETLPAGVYYVQIPASEFAVAGDLLGLRASTGTGAEADPDTDIDNDSNATQAAPTVLAKTGNVTLGSASDALDASEPIDETDSDTWIDGNNRSNLSVDLGFYEPLRVGSLVWSDNGFDGVSAFTLANDNNGVADVGELGIGGVDVELWLDVDLDGVFEPTADDFTGLVGTSTTNLDGSYLFDDLEAGSYFAAIPNSQVALSGLRSSTPETDGGFPEATDDDDDGISAPTYFVRSGVIELAYGDEPSTETGDFGGLNSEARADALAGSTKADSSSQLFVDFGFSPSPLYRLGNIVWRDYDDNGVLDAGEPGIENVTVDLYLDGGLVAGVLDAGDTLVSSDVTDADGHYLFENLDADDYIVHIDSQAVLAGWRTAGTPVVDPEAPLGAGVDNDNNAIVDPVDGWTSGRVVLGGPAGAADHAEPTGETDSNTGNSAEDGVTRDDRSNQTVDFGFYAGLRLGNQVWLDEGAGGNLANGVFDADEDGLAGVTVQLWLDNGDFVFSDSNDTLLATTTTDTEGNYLFGHLEEGAYFVAVPVAGSPDMVSSPGTVGVGLGDDNLDDGAPATDYLAVTSLLSLNIGAASTGELDSTPLGDDLAEVEADAAGDDYRDVDSFLTADLGFTGVPLYRIGNLIWSDWNNDGDAEVLESGISGVLVQLRDSSGATFAETVSDASGRYEFTNLVAGDYSIYIPADQVVDGTLPIGTPAVVPGALDGYFSSTLSVASADANVDNDDNGVDDVVASTIVGWGSGVVTLGDNVSDEPTNETLRSDDATDSDLGQTSPRIDDDFSNYSVDFGFYAISIGNHIWLDDVNNVDNHDDIFDIVALPGVGDAPAVGVTVQLRNATTNAVLQTTTTDALGEYLFTGVADDGNYRVVLPAANFAPGGPLEGWYQVAGHAAGFATPDGRDRGLDSAIHTDVVSADFVANAGSMPTDENAAEDVVNDVVRPDGNTNLFVDFSFSNWTPTYRVGNLVWRDTNNNGLVDGTEAGIDGVEVELYDASSAYVTSTFTAGGGHYVFENLEAGDYSLRIPAAEFVSGNLLGLRASTGAGIEADPDTDVDNNSNAIQSTPIAVAYTAQFTLGAVLDPFDASEPTDETDTDSWVDGDDRSNLSVDLGFYQPLRVGSLVWFDDGTDGLGGVTLANDDNGTADSGETGVSGLTVELWRDVNSDGVFEPGAGDPDVTGLVDITVTDADGTYLFGDLAPGDYFAAIPAGQSPLAGWRSSSPDTNAGLPEASDDDDDGTVAPGYAGVTGQIVLDYATEPTTEVGDFGAAGSEAKANTIAGPTASSNSQLFVDFGFSPMPQYRIGNLVWRDYDDNGVADLGEPGLSGIDVELYFDDGVTPGALDSGDSFVATTATDADGRYSFDGLAADDYLVHIPGQTALDDWRTAGTPVANADGNVDNDNNAVVDATDGWTAGVVTLGGTAGPADHDEPLGETDGTTGSPAEDGLERDDRSNLTVDFGFFAGLRLGNQVWLDDGAGANLDNGVFDSDESGLIGVAVQLWLDDGDSTFGATDTLVASTSTNSDGNYWFEHLEPGNYFVALPAFTGALSSTGTLGLGLVDDNLDDGAPVTGYVAVSGELSLSIGAAVTAEGDVFPTADGSAETEADAVGTTYRDIDSFLTADFGITGVPLYRIGNRVWADWNNNGVAEAGEPGISGVLVQLRDDSDSLVAETVTSAAGFYEFTGLVEGDYSLYIPRDQIVDGTLPIGSPAIVPTALAGFLSSTTTETDADNDVDNDDNGVDHLVGTALVGWSSGLVSLSGTDSEPTTETLRDNDATDDDLGQTTPRIDDDRSNYSVDFGFYSISVGNHLWLDLANDGEYDAATDLPAVGVTVELRDSATDALLLTTTTDASGLYLFTGVVDDGSYVVVIPGESFDDAEPLDGWYPSNGSHSGFTTDGRDRGLTAAHYADVESDAFSVDAGSMPLGENTVDDLVNDSVRPDANTNLYLDFSFYRMELGGVVFSDPTNNGHDDADGYFDDVTLLLYNGSGTPFLRSDGTQATTTTNASGQYSFVGLPTGTFIVEIPSAEFTEELEDLGSSDGNNASGAAPLADSDDLSEDNGNPVSGNLFDGGAVRASVSTLAVDTELAIDRTPTAGVPNRDSNLAVDFGFWMVQIGLELGNQIWFDTDKDGVFDVGTELRAPAGVIIELHDGVTGALLATTTTNALGQYLFSGLSAGTYYLELPTINFLSGHPLNGWSATTGPGVSNTPGDGLDLDSNGQPSGLAVRSAVVSLVAQLPTAEVDSWITVNDDRLSDLTIDFGLEQLDTLAFTGADLEHPAAVAFLLVLMGLLLLFFARFRRRGGRHSGGAAQV